MLYGPIGFGSIISVISTGGLIGRTLLRCLDLTSFFIQVFPKVIQDALKVESWLFVHLLSEDSSGDRDLLLTFFKVLSVFSVKELWVSAFDLLVVLEEALVIDHVLERLPDFL